MPSLAEDLVYRIGIVTAAVLCGARGYKAISDWAQALSPRARARFRCRYRDRKYWVPSESILRDVLIRVSPEEVDQALQGWNALYGAVDESLAIKAISATPKKSGHPARPFPALAELNRIGVNLNQLTRVANATGKIPPGLDPCSGTN